MTPDASRVLLVLLTFLGSMFFAGIEIGVVSCDRIRLRYLSEMGSRRARILLRLLARQDRLIAAISLGANVSSVACSALVTALAIGALGESGAQIVVPVFIFLFMIFAEILPKAIFRVHADTLALLSAYPLAVGHWVLAPGARLLHGISILLARLIPGGGETQSARLTREDLAHFLERSGRAGSAGRRWFRAVLGISERTVADVFVPIEGLPDVGEHDTAAEAARRMHGSGESFLIVLGGPDGAPIGTVGVHHLLAASPDVRVGQLVRPAPRVPASRRIEDLLPEIQAGMAPLAFVMSEDSSDSGRIVGIVTHEAIASAIVGTIEEAPPARVR